eukprot:m.284807 g.284807  ORF g.284807 m.284807 type:complete len:107 (+) comp16200_c0_seq1:110-430(+)
MQNLFRQDSEADESAMASLPKVGLLYKYTGITSRMITDMIPTLAFGGTAGVIGVAYFADNWIGHYLLRYEPVSNALGSYQWSFDEQARRAQEAAEEAAAKKANAAK